MKTESNAKHLLAENCDEDCPVRKTSGIISKKWITLIVRDLIPSKKSYSDLLRSLEPISPKVLSERLRFLSEEKIIVRKVYPTNPPTTEYKLTKLGTRLEPIILEMYNFGKRL